MSSAKPTLPKNALNVVVVVAVVCIGLELTYEKHPHVRFEYWFNFYGFLAIAATLALALLATLARNFLVDKEEATHG